MRFHKEIRFAGDLETVWELLLDADFGGVVAVGTGAESYEISIEETDEGWQASLVSVSSTEGLPSAATKVLGSTMEIRQVELWVGDTQARLTASIPGRPGQISGAITLQVEGAEIVQAVEAEIKANIPLFAGAVEAVIGRALGRVLKIQEQVGADWLAR